MARPGAGAPSPRAACSRSVPAGCDARGPPSAGARIWGDNKGDFSQNRNLIVAAVTLVLGAGDFTLKLGGFTLGGIGTATFGALLLWALLGRSGGRAG